MNIKKLINIALLSLFGLHNAPCNADYLDNFAEQLKEAERKPEAKKAHTKPRTKAKAESPLYSRSEEQAPQPYQPRQYKTESRREQRIMAFFEKTISPIAQELYKLVESKETQQLIETSKKKRLELEKIVAGKMGRGPGAKPRYTTTGGGERGGYGGGYGGSKGYGGRGYGGSGGFGQGGWSPSSSASPWSSHASTRLGDSITSKFDADKRTEPSSSLGKTSTDKEKSYGSTGSSTKDERKKQAKLDSKKQQILNLSGVIQKQLSSCIAKLDDKTKPLAIEDIKKTGAIAALKNAFDLRAAIMTEGKIPPVEIITLQKDIESKEKGLWATFFSHDKPIATKAATESSTKADDSDREYIDLKASVESFFAL